MGESIDMLAGQWTRLGVSFSAEMAAETPDLERLILATARRAPEAPRLLIMAATWLHHYADLVARHRLRALALHELEHEHLATLGLLLDIAQRGCSSLRFGMVIRSLPAQTPPRPLFDVERSTPALAARAQRRSDPISRRWGLWCEEIEFKDDALRPASWIMRNNPSLADRAAFRGDLRASVVAALRHDPDAGTSELQLARRAGGSRAQVRNSLESLELTGRVCRIRRLRPRPTEIRLANAA